MLEKSRNKGITLIALVISIIVLLILAGISISMLSGDNSILQKTTEAKEENEFSQEKEQIALAYNAAIIDKMTQENKAIIKENFDNSIKDYDSGATTLSEGSKIIVTLSNGHKYTIYKNGNVGEYTEPPLARDALTVTVSGDNVTSPYYVNYPSKKGTIKCRVLYNDDTYGLQLISVNPVTTVNLGTNDSNKNVTGNMNSTSRARASYNRSILSLNESTEEFIETSDGSILATDARCVGSNPLDKNYPDNLTGDDRLAEMFTADSSYSYMSSLNGKLFKKDLHCEVDYTRLMTIGALGFDDTTHTDYYWLASREVISNESMTSFWVRRVFSNTLSDNARIFYRSTTGVGSGEYFGGLRPVFILSPNVKIIDGEGTEEVPFEIGL